MYLYPENLKSSAKMWYWKLKDLAVAGSIFLFAVLVLVAAGSWLVVVLAGAYLFLTMQFEDTSILDFLKYAVAYFIAEQQHYEWREEGNG